MQAEEGFQAFARVLCNHFAAVIGQESVDHGAIESGRFAQ